MSVSPDMPSEVHLVSPKTNNSYCNTGTVCVVSIIQIIATVTQVCVIHVHVSIILIIPL